MQKMHRNKKMGTPTSWKRGNPIMAPHLGVQWNRRPGSLDRHLFRRPGQNAPKDCMQKMHRDFEDSPKNRMGEKPVRQTTGHPKRNSWATPEKVTGKTSRTDRIEKVTAERKGTEIHLDNQDGDSAGRQEGPEGQGIGPPGFPGKLLSGHPGHRHDG